MFCLRVKLFSDVEILQVKYKLSQKHQLTDSIVGGGLSKSWEDLSKMYVSNAVRKKQMAPFDVKLSGKFHTSLTITIGHQNVGLQLTIIFIVD